MMLYSADSIIKPLKKAIMEGLAKGYTAERMAVELNAVSATSVYKSKAMIRTAITEAANESERRTSMDLGMSKYEFVATLDERTCPECGRMDGRTANLATAKAGVNFPPMHKNCRCVTTAVVNDEVKSEMTRRARDSDGHSRTVPASMTYAQWRSEFVKP
jgi:SPP1 gp7 family putative phage head morphogenesis protein